MTAPNAEDQSWASLNPASAKAHGIRLVCDYLSHDPTKDWTAPQIRAYLAAGIGCEFLWETNSDRALTGYAGGLADGQSAAAELNGLINAVGFRPAAKLGICAAVDFDTNPSEYGAINAYFQGFRAGVAGQFLIGAYGEADLLDELGGIIDFGFQTYAWSGGRLSARATLYQYLNGQTIDDAEIDFDRIINESALGAWWPAGYTPSSGGSAPITPGGNSMSFDAGEVDQIAKSAGAGVQNWPVTRPDGSTAAMYIALGEMYAMISQENAAIAGVAATVTALKGANAPGGEPVDEAKLAADLAVSLSASLPPAVLAALKEAL